MFDIKMIKIHLSNSFPCFFNKNTCCKTNKNRLVADYAYLSMHISQNMIFQRTECS